MIGFAEATETLKVRGITIDEKEFFFTLMVILQDSPHSAYALVYDTEKYREHIGGEHEEAYLASKEQAANELLCKQNIVQLRDLLEESFREQVQAETLTLKDFRFSGKETVQILNNLLKNRIDDIENASVKDIVSVIKTLSDQGALDVGDSGFARHFIQVFPPYTAVCVSCSKEFEAHAGMGVVCPHCHQQYRWSTEEERFYPEMAHL